MLAPSTLLPDLKKLDLALRTKIVGKKTTVSEVSLIETTRAHETVCSTIEIPQLEGHQRMTVMDWMNSDLARYMVKTDSGYFRVCCEVLEPNLKGKING